MLKIKNYMAGPIIWVINMTKMNTRNSTWWWGYMAPGHEMRWGLLYLFSLKNVGRKFPAQVSSKKRQGNGGWPRIHLERYGLYRELKTKSSEIEAGSAAETPKLGKEFMRYGQISLALTAISVLLCAWLSVYTPSWSSACLVLEDSVGNWWLMY